MTTRARNTYDLDRLADVEDELTLALRSLDDLEAEHASGQVSEETYQRLHASYTVRAADAARSRRQLAKRKPEVAPRSRRSWLVIAVVLVVVFSVVGVALALGSHGRQPGATITGDSAAASTDTPERQARLDAKAEQRLVNGDLAGALRSFISALKVNPRDIEALSYAGWLSFLAGGGHQQSARLLRTAVRTDPSYPDAHAFLGIVLLRSHREPDLARAELRTYLRLVPSGQMSGQVRRVLQVAAGSASPDGAEGTHAR
jgi:cytochrome c-type biogenesis protein CcmH/NrfG